MATAITVRKYTVDVSYKLNRNSVRNIERSFRDFEKKLKRLSKSLSRSLTFGIDRFVVNRRNLNIALGDALDAASRRVVFEVSRFVVNDRNLQAALMRAARRTGNNLGGGGGGSRPRRSPQERLQKEGMAFARAWNQAHAEDARRTRQAQAAQQLAQRERELSRRVIGGSGATRAGGTAGIASRAYLPLLGLAGGGYGLAQLNQRNQQVVSAQLQTSAVVQQAGGTARQGGQSFDYLRSEADRIGFNYLEASGDYNKLIAGLTGAGVGLGESQKVFSGFAELSRVNKLDRVTQNRLFRALSQVAGKGKLQAEELTGQIAK